MCCTRSRPGSTKVVSPSQSKWRATLFSCRTSGDSEFWGKKSGHNEIIITVGPYSALSQVSPRPRYFHNQNEAGYTLYIIFNPVALLMVTQIHLYLAWHLNITRSFNSFKNLMRQLCFGVFFAFWLNRLLWYRFKEYNTLMLDMLLKCVEKWSLNKDIHLRLCHLILHYFAHTFLCIMLLFQSISPLTLLKKMISV